MMRRAVFTGCAMVALGYAGACDSSARPTEAPVDVKTTPLSPAPFIVSSPVPGVALGQAAPRAAANAVSTVVYVSLPSGAIPSGVAAYISDAHAGSSASTPVVNGGFDPVAIAASVGDTISVVVQTTAGGVASVRFTVPTATPPIIVRTEPPPHKRDVPLNARVVVVFSEPIAAAALNTASISLRQGNAPVEGTLEFGDAAHTNVQFVPAAPLTAATDYELVVTADVRDLGGTALAEPFSASFTTVPAPPPNPPTSIVVVSHPVNGRTVGGASGLITYVSLPSGTFPVPDGTYADIKTPRAGALGYYDMGTFVNGGFDPRPIAAEAGDIVTVTIHGVDGGPPTVLTAVVPSASSPRIVRTEPIAQQRDVPLNAHVAVVFSQPIDVSKLANLQLWSGGRSVGGEPSVTFPGDVLAAYFVPNAPLDAGAAFEIHLTTGIRGTDGAPLTQAVTVPFTTAAVPADGLPATALSIAAFSMVEYQYPTGPQTWYYSPILLVSETGGNAGVKVVKMVLTVDRLAITPICSLGVPVGAGQTRDLDPEVYGDYEWAFFDPGKRVTASEATVALTYMDDWGRTGTLTATGPIMSGGLPGTYTGGPPVWGPGATICSR